MSRACNLRPLVRAAFARAGEQDPNLPSEISTLGRSRINNVLRLWLQVPDGVPEGQLRAALG